MTISTNLKKSFSYLFLTFFLALTVFGFVAPSKAYATVPSTGTSGVQTVSGTAIPSVTIGNDGSMTITGDGFTTDSTSAWSAFLAKYRMFIVGISGVGAVTMVVLFIIQFLKLGASAGNPQARTQALTGVLWTGIAAAGLGAVSIIVGFFYNAIGH